MRSVLRRCSAVVVLAVVLAVPVTAFATSSSANFRTTNLSWQHCTSVAQSSLASSGFGDVMDAGSGVVYGRAGEYSASVVCIDQQAVSVSVAGPDGNVATAMRDRVLSAF